MKHANRKFRWLVIAAILLVTAGPALAQPTTQPTATQPVTTQPSGIENAPVGGTFDGETGGELYDWLQLALAMAIIVVLILVFRVVLKRVGSSGLRAGAGIEIVTRAGLTQKHQVFVVRVGGRTMLIGCGPEAVTNLAELSDMPGEAPTQKQTDKDAK